MKNRFVVCAGCQQHCFVEFFVLVESFPNNDTVLVCLVPMGMKAVAFEAAGGESLGLESGLKCVLFGKIIPGTSFW